MSDPVWRLSGDLSKDVTLALEAITERFYDDRGLMPPTVSFFEQRQTPLWRVELFFAGAPDRDMLKALLAEAGLADWPHHLEPLEDKDWVSESQRLLDPVEAGRFYVHGSHDADKAGDTVINLTVDAGQAFGTGRHETTHGCLSALDQMAESRFERILDLGTGSGVLAMAAHRLWPHARLLATDIDPIAVEVTKDNLKTNGCQARRVGDETAGIAALTADGLADPAFRAEGPFDLVIANILAGPLVLLAPDIERVTTHGGRVMLSGLLDSQEVDVLSAYTNLGLTLETRIQEAEWLALVLMKP